MFAVKGQGKFRLQNDVSYANFPQCSNDATCKTCSELILRSHSRKTLAFSGCIRTRLHEVGFFEASKLVIPPRSYYF